MRLPMVLFLLGLLACAASGLSIGAAGIGRTAQRARVRACSSSATETEQIITFSERGMRRLLELQEAQGGELVVRMGVRDGNSASENGEYSYRMEPTTAHAVTSEDTEIRYGGNIRCVVDSQSLPYLRGLHVDYSDKTIGGGFLFSNPNAKKTCGCSRTFDVKEGLAP